MAKGEIAAFVEDFLKHWKTHWKARKVKRFILALPADFRSHERRAELETARKRFNKHRVNFYLWHKRELTHRIRRDANIRREFFGEWSVIGAPAGTQRVTTTHDGLSTSPLSAVIVGHVHDLQLAFGESVGALLDRYRDAWRRGEDLDVGRALAKLRSNKSRWDALTPAIQARAMRMQALHAMDSRSLPRAKQLLQTADALAPKGGRRFQALLTYRQSGSQRALQVLSKVDSKEDAFVQASLLLECNRPADARAALRQWQSKAKNEPEWRRLMACAAFIHGQRSVGLEHIREAERLAPDWTNVIFTGAVLRYGAALSPVVGFRMTRLPEPVHLDLVLRDDDNQTLLREALNKFQLLIDRAQTAEGREQYEAWKLACLCNLVGEDSQASAFCVSLVNRRRLSINACFWGLARRYPIGKGVVVGRLVAKLRRGTRDVDCLQALLACHFAAGDTERARRALERHGAHFRDASSRQVLASWRERLSIKTEKRLKTGVRREPFVALERAVAHASQSNDWSALAALLKSVGYAPDVVFAACGALASRGQWHAVTTHMNVLLESVRSAESTRLAVYALYNTEAFVRVLEVLEKYSSRFPGGNLPEDLQRLRAYATARQGDLLEARSLAISLARTTQQSADKLLAAQLHIHGGDVSGALPFVRDALEQHDGKPQQLLRLLPSVFNEDPALAGQLLKKALAQGLNPDEGVFAMGWAYKLGLQVEANDLLTNLSSHQDATKGGLRSASLDEVRTFIQQRHEAAAELTRCYERGVGPIHVVAGALGVNLARIWQNAFDPNCAGGALLIRHGNRSTDFFGSQYPSIVTLALDITALLTAEWLGLLDVLEASKVRLALPNSLMTLLQYLEQDAHHHQPSRIKTVQQVVDYVDNHLSCLFNLGLDGDVNSSTARVVFELLGEAPASSMPRITLSALGAELARRGGTTAAELERLRAQLSGWSQSATETDAQQLRTLEFEHNTIDALFDSGLFDATMDRFEIRVQGEHYENCLAELRHYREREALAERLRLLRRRIANGIDHGRYTILPAPPCGETSTDLSRREILLDPLTELLGLSFAEGHWIWIDDRYCTGFVNAQGNSIVCAYEVLRYLNDHAGLPKEKFYAALSKLRRANVGFLPLTAAEVLFHLHQAAIGDEGLIETPELADIRIALNGLLRRESDLELETTNGLGDRVPELHALVVAYRIAKECLEQIWRVANAPINIRLAQSDWVWESLRVERFSRIPVGADASAAQKLWRINLVHLLTIGVSVPVQDVDGDADGALKSFNSWLERELPDLGVQGDHDLLDFVSEHLTDLLLGILKPLQADRSDETESLDDARRIVTRFTERLPQEVRRRLYESEALQTTLRPNLVTVVHIGDRAFEASRFWVALESAWNGTESTVTSIRGQAFQARRDGDGIMLSGDANLRLTDPDLPLLERDSLTRRARLRQELIVEIAEQSESFVEHLLGLESPFERMKLIREIRESGAAARYVTLGSLLDSHDEFAASELLPSGAEQYVAYLNSNELVKVTDWARTAATLLAKVGLRETLRRLAGVPIRLPLPLVEEFGRLGPVRSREMLGTLLQDAKSPLRRLKLLELLCAGERTLHEEAAESLVSEIVATWKADASAFIAVLNWSERVWRRDPRWRALPTAQRLACTWAHADQVLSMFSTRGIGSDFVRERFKELHGNSVRDLLLFDFEFESDVSAPKRMSSEALLIHGFNTALGSNSALLLGAHAAALLDLLTMRGEQRSLPVIGLIADRRDGRDAIGAIFSVKLDAWYSELILFEGIPLLSELGRNEMRKQAVERVSADSTNLDAWMQVAMIGLPWLPTESRANVDQAVEHIKFESTDENASMMALVLASIVPYFDPKARAALERQVVDWAQELSKVYAGQKIGEPATTPSDRAADAVIELTVALSRAEVFSQTLGDLARSVQGIANAWPALTKRLRNVVARILRECTSDERVTLWKTFVEFRAQS